MRCMQLVLGPLGNLPHPEHARRRDMYRSMGLKECTVYKKNRNTDGSLSLAFAESEAKVQAAKKKLPPSTGIEGTTYGDRRDLAATNADKQRSDLYRYRTGKSSKSKRKTKPGLKICRASGMKAEIPERSISKRSVQERRPGTNEAAVQEQAQKQGKLREVAGRKIKARSAAREMNGMEVKMKHDSTKI